MSAKKHKKPQKNTCREKPYTAFFTFHTQTVQLTISIIIQEMSVKLRNERQFNLSKKIEMLSL